MPKHTIRTETPPESRFNAKGGKPNKKELFTVLKTERIRLCVWRLAQVALSRWRSSNV